MRRRGTMLLLAVVGALAVTGPAFAQEDEAPTDGSESVPTTISPLTSLAPPTTIPVGCDVPDPPTALFTARFIAEDFTPDGSRDTTRFHLVELRAGTLDGFLAIGQLGGVTYENLVDVEFGADAEFLELGQTYLIAADVNPESGLMRSKLRPVQPMFGEDEVLGADDGSEPLICPVVADQVLTRKESGEEINTGLFSRFFSERRSILWAFLRPAIAAFVALLVLVVVKRVLFAGGRMSRRMARRTLRRRQREQVRAQSAVARAPRRPDPANEESESPELVG